MKFLVEEVKCNLTLSIMTSMIFNRALRVQIGYHKAILPNFSLHQVDINDDVGIKYIIIWINFKNGGHPIMSIVLNLVTKLF